MSDLHQLTKLVVAFREERDWEKFHNPKDMAMSLSLEASEVLEHFQWKTEADLDKYVEENKKEIGEELSDVLYWILLMSHDFDIDLIDAFQEKMKLNAKKYPAEKVKGKSDKYSQYE